MVVTSSPTQSNNTPCGSQIWLITRNEGLPNPTQTRKTPRRRGWGVGENPTPVTPAVTTCAVLLQLGSSFAVIRGLVRRRRCGLLLASHLLRLQVLVEEEKGRLVRLGRAHDGEHALACLVMGGLPPRVSRGTTRNGGKLGSLTLAMEIRAPDVLRISLILDPARPMMQPTISAGMLMFCVWISSPFSS